MIHRSSIGSQSARNGGVQKISGLWDGSSWKPAQVVHHIHEGAGLTIRREKQAQEWVVYWKGRKGKRASWQRAGESARNW